jgi:hypothetical protein
MAEPPIRCEDYVRISLGGWRLWLHKRFDRLSETLVDPQRHFDGVRGPFRRIPSSDHARVFKGSLSLLGRIHHVYLKQYLYRSPRDFVKHLFRRSRAMRSFRATLLLARNGLDAPRVIAVGECRRFLFCTRCFVVTSSLEGAKPVYVWLGRDLPAADRHGRRRRRTFIRGLGGAVGRMHARGVCHGDLRPGNILADDAGDDWRFYLLDNERTRAYKHLPRRLRIKNLVQIGMFHLDRVGKTDRMRFFKAYLREDPSLIGRHKRLAAAVSARIRQRLAGKTAAGAATRPA